MPDLSLPIERSRACATPYGVYFAHVWNVDPSAKGKVRADDYSLGSLTERYSRPEAIAELTTRLQTDMARVGTDVGRVLSVAYLRFCYGDRHKGFKPTRSVTSFERVASFALLQPGNPVVVLRNVSPRSKYLPDTRLSEVEHDQRALMRRIMIPTMTLVEPPITPLEHEDPGIRIEQGVFDWRNEVIVGLHSLPPHDSRGEYIERLAEAHDFWRQ